MLSSDINRPSYDLRRLTMRALRAPARVQQLGKFDVVQPSRQRADSSKRQGKVLGTAHGARRSDYCTPLRALLISNERVLEHSQLRSVYGPAERAGA